MEQGRLSVREYCNTERKQQLRSGHTYTCTCTCTYIFTLCMYIHVHVQCMCIHVVYKLLFMQTAIYMYIVYTLYIRVYTVCLFRVCIDLMLH